ncbi:DUF2264 domain-containing protein (plasmid) [Coraliomargarita sp. W4R53]
MHALPSLTSAGLSLATRPTPPEDRGLSPFTGLSRDHWVAVAHDLLDSAARFQSASGARFDFPGRPSQQGAIIDGLEGFARSFQLAAFLSIGEASPAAQRHLDRYLTGLIAGTSPTSEEAWEPIGHVGGPGGQSQVEAANIALCLHLTRSKTWDVLTPTQQDQVVDWLRPALDKETSPNNWYLFGMTIGSFLEAVGRGDEQTRWAIARALEMIEEWYRGRGWYSDGDGDAYDHYVGWAMHLYPLLHARLRPDPALETLLGTRLSTFLETFSRTFDRTGAPVYMGRSMTYRTATVAALSLGAITGHTPLTPGQSRRIMSANLRYFFERDATHDGIFTAGWHGPHEASLQRYSGPGSPYWAAKGFSALMLPATHELWTATESSVPGDAHDLVDPIADIGLMIQSTVSDGIARVHNHGSDNIKPHDPGSGAPDPLYARFAYSTRTGPTALHNASDNDFQLQYREVWSARHKIHRGGAGTDWISSWHHPRFPKFSPLPASENAAPGSFFPSARIQSVTVAHGGLEVRIHRTRLLPPGCPVRLSGWAIADSRPESIEIAMQGDGVSIRNSEMLTSFLTGVHGWTGAARSQPATWGTAFGCWAIMPELHATTDSELLVALAALSADPDMHEAIEAVRINVDGALVTVDWGDSAQESVINLDSLDWGVRPASSALI